jgi:hypothetical protein
MDVGKLRFLFTALSSLFGQCSAVSYSWHKHHVFGLLDVAYRIMTSVFSATWWKKTIITFSWVVQLSTSSGALSLVGPVYPRLFLQLKIIDQIMVDVKFWATASRGRFSFPPS